MLTQMGWKMQMAKQMWEYCLEMTIVFTINEKSHTQERDGDGEIGWGRKANIHPVPHPERFHCDRLNEGHGSHGDANYFGVQIRVILILREGGWDKERTQFTAPSEHKSPT